MTSVTPPPQQVPDGTDAAPPEAGTAPVVPYGPPVTDPGAPTSSATVVLSGQSVAGTAGKWAVRMLLPLLIRAIFRAIFR